MYYELMHCLRLLKFFSDIGILEKIADDYQEISGDDRYELFLEACQHIAPLYEMEELGEDVCCGGHVVYRFSDPALLEYYRLCRQYEQKHSIPPEQNPYVIEADEYYIECCRQTTSDFGTNFEDLENPKGIWIETCPERPVDERELLELVHNLMKYFREKVVILRNELRKSPVLQFRAPKKKAYRSKKPRAERNNELRKAS